MGECGGQDQSGGSEELMGEAKGTKKGGNEGRSVDAHRESRESS